MNDFRNNLPIRWLLLLLMICNAGCSGCRRDQPVPADANAAKREKPDFDAKPLVLLPGQFDQESSLNFTKLGHWYAANVRIVANNFDVTGLFDASSVSASGEPILLSGGSAAVNFTRPYALAKEQPKVLEFWSFLPYRSTRATAAYVKTDLISLSGLPQYSRIDPVKTMLPYQHHLVVLTRDNDRLSFLRFIDALGLPPSEGSAIPPFLVTVFPTKDQPVPLASTVLGWTSTAYLLWDDLSAEELTAEQQQALLDWLHFGGQLIINGPKAFTSLEKSFLRDYLPATSAEAQNLAAEQLQTLNGNWALPDRINSQVKRELVIPPAVPLLGIKLTLAAEGRWVDGTGELVAERLVGRGRIVVNSFDLADPRVKKWQSLPSFVNGALLRLPPRVFGRSNSDTASFRWDRDGVFIFDPLMWSKLRFASRDLGSAGTLPAASEDGFHWKASPNSPSSIPSVSANDPRSFDLFSDYLITNNLPNNELLERNLSENTWAYGGAEVTPQAGVAGWNDHQGLSSAAKETLRYSASIRPPQRWFVAQILLGYLIVLIPLNWGICWLIGKVEWAWLSAPLIAIAGAIVVIKVSSLDIGFGSAQTEIAVIELPYGHNRGHLTQYAAIYSSLSTRYELEFPQETGLALPFTAREKLRPDQVSINRMELNQAQQNKLVGFLVQSNSTSMFHAEQMVPVGGALRLERQANQWRLVNDTQLELRNCGVVFGARTADGLSVCWLGDVRPGTQTELSLKSAEANDWFEPWMRQALFQSSEELAWRIWEKLETEENSVDSRVLFDLPDLAAYKAELQRRFVKPANVPQSLWEQDPRISLEEFVDLYRATTQNSEATQPSLGSMLDVLRRSIPAGSDSIYLIGEVANELSGVQVEPKPPVIRRSMLILAHLSQPQLPPAKADIGALIDYGATYNQFEDEELEKQSDQD